MPCFDKDFSRSKEDCIYFNGVKLIRLDNFPITDGEVLLLSIEKTINKDRYLQGFCIDIMGHAEINGQIFKKGKRIGLKFWENSMPQNQKIKIFTKSGFVSIYNICETDIIHLTIDDTEKKQTRSSKSVNYWIGGAAMIVEEIPHGRRYRCSDVSCADKKDQFGDIVFTVQKT